MCALQLALTTLSFSVRMLVFNECFTPKLQFALSAQKHETLFQSSYT